MTSGKIVKKFFSKADAEKAATYQRDLAKQEGRIVLKVRVVNAYELYQANGWFKSKPFKSLGIPDVDQYMVVVLYNLKVVLVKRTSSLKKKIATAAKTKTASKVFKVVKLNDCQRIKMMSFAHVSNSTVPAVRFKYRTTHSVGHLAFTSCSMAVPTYSCQFAA